MYIDSGKRWRTREIAEYARENGYDSVRINNVHDFGGNGEATNGYGDIGIFYLDGSAYCKILHKAGRKLSLVSINSAYKPIPVRETSEFKVFGKVVI